MAQIEKVVIGRISHFDKDKNGGQLTSKQGKPYTRCLIDLVDGRKVSGFGNATTKAWSQGDEISIEISQSGEYWNFNIPKVATGGGLSDQDRETLMRLEKKIDSINWHIIEFLKAQKSGKPMYPSPEVEGIKIEEPPEELTEEAVPW